MAEPSSCGTALNTAEILNNYGGEIRNNLIALSNLNDDEADNIMSTKKSLYYDLDGMIKFLKTNSENITLK